MLADGCVRLPVLAADFSPTVQFQELNNDTLKAALLNSSNFSRKHLNFSPEEFSRNPFALLAGRVFRVTFRGNLSYLNRRIHFSTQHLCATLISTFVSFSLFLYPPHSFSVTE